MSQSARSSLTPSPDAVRPLAGYLHAVKGLTRRQAVAVAYRVSKRRCRERAWVAALKRRDRVIVLPGTARRRHSPRPTVRRAAARRAAGVRAGTDPGDDGDPERPPPRRGELRHLKFALAEFLEEIRPEGVAR